MSNENAIDDFYPLDGFMSYDTTNEWLGILRKKYPSKITIESIGETYEGRDIKAVYINKQQEQKVIVVANLHAREWAAMSSAIYIIHEMIYHAEKYSEVSKYQWIVVPISNPDGYEYTRTTDRFWRKNRKIPLGIDLNRNFGFKWEVEVSPDEKTPEGESYRGPSPFSATESQAIANVLKQHAQSTLLYVDLHTYGETILFPWSFTDDPAPNANWSRSVAEEGARGILLRTGKTYQVGTPAERSFKESGSSIDYCFNLNIKACIAIELTAGSYEVQNSSIPVTGQEALAAVQTMAIHVELANPDGYEYSRTDDPLWSKNRSPITVDEFGVDLDRNFEYMWDLNEASDDPFDDSPDKFNPLNLFMSYYETNRWLLTIEEQYPDKCKVQSIGKSYLLRDINAIYINKHQQKKIFIVANMHAREWAAMTSAIYIIHELLRNSNSYKEASQYQWIIVPIANPDGYEHTRSLNRFWRKNRSLLDSFDFGVDLNRNFDYKWDLVVNPDDVKFESETYRGPRPFSESESRAIGKLLQENADSIVFPDSFNPLDFFMSYDESNLWLAALEAKYPDKCKVEPIGKSYEGRDINAIYINKHQENKVFVVANMHAREWAAMTSAIYIIHELLRNSITREASFYQWIVVPIANPDGYEYTKTEDRLWRKNRSPQLDNAIGVDLNRNFGYMWELLINEENDNPNEQTYRGPSAFSEPESRAIGDFLQQNVDSIILFVDLHTYGQYIMIPWSYTIEPVPNAEWLLSVAQAGAAATLSRTNQFYLAGTPAELVYTVSGSCIDYCQSVGVKACINRTWADEFNVFDFFLSYEETQQWLEALATEYPERCQLQTLDETYEGRNISAIRINYNSPKKIIVIGNFQAREWVGMTSAVFIIHELIRNARSYPEANEYQWILVPMPNPDGYEYSREHDRKWNKNRSPQRDENFGVNLDSNFNNQWNVNGVPSRADPAGRAYRGPSPFSEPETRAIRDLMETHMDAVLFIDLQAFGQLILIPWSWTDEPAPNADQLRAVANAGNAAILDQSQEIFEVGVTSDFLPFAYGVCHDYCNKLGVKACITLKQTLQGFDLSTDQIIHFGQEAFVAILAMARQSDQQLVYELAGPSDALHRFLSYEETNKFLYNLASFFSSKVSVETIGETGLGRDINVININYSAKKTVILVANLHAREWAAMTSALYIISELAYNGDQYPELSQFRWMIIPMANPDGYEYTREYDRYWSKNRSPQPDSRTFGVDLNGNFGYKWEENNKPVDPSNRIYNGPSAFSERESSAIGSLLNQYADSTILYVDMHTFGNHIFYPWGYTTDPAPDAEKSRAVALAASDVIRAKYQEHYTVGTPANLFKRTFGTSLDYCHSMGINVCLWLEMTNVGFTFEEDKIVHYGQEAWDAITTMAVRANALVDVFYTE
uniref:Peptidase M14 domain-containing protein n=1 Tax=Anopheles christyi TaxID=43041 RepID=A0A182JPF8_9DIPT